ncbi:hypothetical protein EDB80DRAFT_840968 [Ilyonectria destructans]|nr:hypothetical protein EDB80DRAFT_840968 [Ilyonectria destructans]
MCNDRPPIGRNSGLVLSCSNTCLPSSGSGPFLAWLFHDLLDAREQRQGPEQEPKERGMGRASKGQRRSSAPFGDGEGEQTRRSPLAASGNAQAKAQMVTYILSAVQEQGAVHKASIRSAANPATSESENELPIHTRRFWVGDDKVQMLVPAARMARLGGTIAIDWDPSPWSALSGSGSWSCWPCPDSSASLASYNLSSLPVAVKSSTIHSTHEPHCPTTAGTKVPVRVIKLCFTLSQLRSAMSGPHLGRSQHTCNRHLSAPSQMTGQLEAHPPSYEPTSQPTVAVDLSTKSNTAPRTDRAAKWYCHRFYEPQT